MKHEGKDKILNFFEDKGFYIILFLCVAAIGISGYVLFFSPAEDPSDPLDGYVYHPIESGDSSSVSASQPVSDVPVAETKPKTNDSLKPPAKTENKTSSTPKQTPKSDKKAAPLFVMPVKGTIIKPFSGEDLVFDETMGDWRTHSGTDFAAKAGERVYAISDGKVEDVYTDGMYGRSILIDHGDGLKSLYTGLKDKTNVKKGSTVKGGDVIGGVGDSMPAESAQPSHLHLVIIKNDKKIDAQDILPAAED